MEEEEKSSNKRLAFCLPLSKNTSRNQIDCSKLQSQPRQVNILKKLLYSMSSPPTYSIDEDSSNGSEIAIDFIQHPKPMLVESLGKEEVMPNSNDAIASTSSTQCKFDPNLENIGTKCLPMCVVTLVGMNKGASMVTDNGRHPNHQANCTSGSKKSERDPSDRNIVNSNTLSINNSILQRSSCRDRSSGVYVNIHTDGGECVNSTMQKPKITSTRKLSLQQPTSVRGRCLMGHLSD